MVRGLFIAAVSIGLALGSALGAATAGAADRQGSAQPPCDAELNALISEIRPPDELWETIPWQVSVLEARSLAAKEGKPVFVSVLGGQMFACG